MKKCIYLCSLYERRTFVLFDLTNKKPLWHFEAQITGPDFLNTPVSVACDEAVSLANKYSDIQGRKMINGVLRRLQNIKLK